MRKAWRRVAPPLPRGTFVVSARIMRAWVRLGLGVAIAGVALGCVAWQACANSILRNAVEAGIETVLEGPLPTPTPVDRPRALDR